MELHARDALPETPDPDGAFPRLSEEQVAALGRRGERRPVREHEVLIREGEAGHDFFVVLAGRVAVVDGFGTDDERLIAVHGPHRFLGELTMLTGQPSFLTDVALSDGEVLAVPIGRLHELVAEDAALGDLILHALLLRRGRLIGLGAGPRIVGSRFSPEARRLRELAARNRLPHTWIELERDPDAELLLRRLGVAPTETPVVLVPGGRVLRHPSPREFALAVGLPAPAPDEAECDVVVVGAGPAGLAASVYGASDGLRTVTVDGVATGGQAGTSPRIENYLGFPSGISGSELAERATIQARKFGATFTVPGEAVALEQRDGRHAVRLEDGATVLARTVVVASGARYRRLALAGLDQFEGDCVFHAATLEEARACTGDPVAVVGGGNSAGQAALFLADHAVLVHLLMREDDLEADMSRYLAERIRRQPRVEVHLSTEARELRGDTVLRTIVVEDTRTHARSEIEARLLFVFIGSTPHTGWLGDAVALDEHGFVLTGDDVPAPDGHRPGTFESSRPGVFAVGDVRHGSVKRMTTAVGEGAMVVRLVFEHLHARDGSRPVGGA